MIEQNQLKYWLAALHLPKIGSVTIKRWLEQLDNISQLFTEKREVLKAIGFTTKEISILNTVDWYLVEKELAWCQKNSCHIITIQDPRYPTLLSEIYSAPPVLFVRGNVEILSQPQLAMVGSRNPSQMGIETAENFASYFAKSGFIVTSGLALGIDGASHRGALREGQTIAVLGAGLSRIYPASHAALAEQILSEGALISEFPPFALPKAVNFPLRNRLISGLSVGVLVVEAALQSGSLITARYALEQGREVFAIPGSIHSPTSKGCHHLIRQGAKLVETAQDIVEEVRTYLDLFSQQLSDEIAADLPLHVDEKKKQVLKSVGFETTSLDTIMSRSRLTPGEVSSILLGLELEGFVQTVVGGYTRTSIR